MIPIVNVIQVRATGGHRLCVRFSDGSFGEHDFSDLVALTGAMMEPLRDPAFFARVFVELGVLTWPNGFDIDAIQLHREMATGGELHRGSEQRAAPQGA